MDGVADQLIERFDTGDLVMTVALYVVVASSARRDPGRRADSGLAVGQAWLVGEEDARRAPPGRLTGRSLHGDSVCSGRAGRRSRIRRYCCGRFSAGPARGALHFPLATVAPGRRPHA